jgi:hypothetical protein
MPEPGIRIRIALVRSWLRKLEPVRAALRSAGLAPTFVRVDIEPALNAVLTRGEIDVVIYDPEIDGLSRAVVEARCKELRPGLPCLPIGKLEDLGARVTAVIMKLRN